MQEELNATEPAVESGGDHLAASLSAELVDVSMSVIDVSGGDKMPRKVCW